MALWQTTCQNNSVTCMHTCTDTHTHTHALIHRKNSEALTYRVFIVGKTLPSANPADRNAGIWQSNSVTHRNKHRQQTQTSFILLGLFEGQLVSFSMLQLIARGCLHNDLFDQRILIRAPTHSGSR